MSDPTAQNLCGSCRHFARQGPLTKGYCHAEPPTVFANGFSRRPEVGDRELGCRHHDDSVAGAVLGKTNPDTPGHAAVQARADKVKGKAR